MDISRMLNPKTPSPEPPYKGAGNPKGGPNNNGPNNNPSGLSSSSKAPNSSEDKRSNTPDSPKDEPVTYYSLSDWDIVDYLQREKQRVVDERISTNSSYTSLTLSDLGIKLKGDWRNNPYIFYLNRNFYYRDTSAWTNKYGTVKSFGAGNVDTIIDLIIKNNN